MAEKWTVQQLDLEEYPNMQPRTGNTLLYKVVDASGEMRSAHHWEEDARQMVASPQMLEALERMIKYIEAGAGATAEIEYGAVLNQARAAIAAAKGE
jgi:hypothetical protein